MDLDPEAVVKTLGRHRRRMGETSMAKTVTVREQMAKALEAAAEHYHRLWCPDRTAFEDCKYPTCADSRRALDRHRDEPEEQADA